MAGPGSGQAPSRAGDRASIGGWASRAIRGLIVKETPVKRHLLTCLALILASTLGSWAIPSAASAAACPNPKFVTSDDNGMWSQGNYIVHNNVWNRSSYRMSERLSACSHANWKAVATADNSSGDGAVKSYPNVHRDYHNWNTGREPLVRQFSTIRSSWSAHSPRRGIYDTAYDIWLDGVPGDHEVMIWTHNRQQTPAGSRVGTARVGHHTWRVWATQDNSYIAFVPKHRLEHGTVDIKAMLRWLMKRQRIERNATLGQICFGFEVVSTGGDPTTFKVNRFSVTSKRR